MVLYANLDKNIYKNSFFVFVKIYKTRISSHSLHQREPRLGEGGGVEDDVGDGGDGGAAREDGDVAAVVGAGGAGGFVEGFFEGPCAQHGFDIAGGYGGQFGLGEDAGEDARELGAGSFYVDAYAVVVGGWYGYHGTRRAVAHRDGAAAAVGHEHPRAPVGVVDLYGTLAEGFFDESGHDFFFGAVTFATGNVGGHCRAIYPDSVDFSQFAHKRCN